MIKHNEIPCLGDTSRKTWGCELVGHMEKLLEFFVKYFLI